VSKFLIAQSDEPELLWWLLKACQLGGSFVSSIARAGLVADYENYPLIRPLLLVLREKYPEYEATERLKKEIRSRQPK
jgi:hypothetical protein